MSRRYRVVSAAPYNAQQHRRGTLGRDGSCGLHGCGEAAVITMLGEDIGGRRMTLGVCGRGVVEYGLTDLQPREQR